MGTIPAGGTDIIAVKRAVPGTPEVLGGHRARKNALRAQKRAKAHTRRECVALTCLAGVRGSSCCCLLQLQLSWAALRDQRTATYGAAQLTLTNTPKRHGIERMQGVLWHTEKLYGFTGAASPSVAISKVSFTGYPHRRTPSYSWSW